MSQNLLNKHLAVPDIRTEQLAGPFLPSITFLAPQSLHIAW